jgi:hypothetical protein
MNTEDSVDIRVELSNLGCLFACPPQTLRVAVEARTLSRALCVPELCDLCDSVVRSSVTRASARRLRTEDVING